MTPSEARPHATLDLVVPERLPSGAGAASLNDLVNSIGPAEQD